MLVLVGLGAPILAHKFDFPKTKRRSKESCDYTWTNYGYDDMTLNWIEEISRRLELGQVDKYDFEGTYTQTQHHAPWSSILGASNV